MIRLIKSALPKKDAFLALSMGIDSVAAFHFLLSKGHIFTPVHFNHVLREQNNLMEEKFYDLCSKFKLKGKSNKGSDLVTEKDCREARLNFYDSLGGNIITAHHLNDWVESYLLNCLRGKSEQKPFELMSEFPKFKIFHPFLLSRKKDFEQYVLRNNLKDFVVEDETNSNIKGSRRNWIRKNLIPEILSQKISLEKYALKKILEEVDNNKILDYNAAKNES
jgi:tRNA(Ile)-lysidine synthetase-like protein